FQAEDGIRDGHVTGVQTCALPIWRRLRVGVQPEVGVNVYHARHHRKMRRVDDRRAQGDIRAAANGYDLAVAHQYDPVCDLSLRRSEERRVGKECRSWLLG